VPRFTVVITASLFGISPLALLLTAFCSREGYVFLPFGGLSKVLACISSSADRTVPKTLEVAFRADMKGSKEVRSDPKMIA
jgi:hypothetical protein